MTQNIRYSVDADGIAILAIDVAGRPMNVLTPEFRADLAACVEPQNHAGVAVCFPRQRTHQCRGNRLDGKPEGA